MLHLTVRKILNEIIIFHLYIGFSTVLYCVVFIVSLLRDDILLFI